jgi:hypothetical protein
MARPKKEPLDEFAVVKARAWRLVADQAAPLADRVMAADTIVFCHFARSAEIRRSRGDGHPPWQVYAARYLANEHPSAIFGADVRAVLRDKYPLDGYASAEAGDLRDGFTIWDTAAPTRQLRRQAA